MDDNDAVRYQCYPGKGKERKRKKTRAEKQEIGSVLCTSHKTDDNGNDYD